MTKLLRGVPIHSFVKKPAVSSTYHRKENVKLKENNPPPSLPRPSHTGPSSVSLLFGTVLLLLEGTQHNSEEPCSCVDTTRSHNCIERR